MAKKETEVVAEVTELLRSNKVTAYWEGDGVAVGVFYKTHEKVITVKSNDDSVVKAGFVFPIGTEEAPATAQQKLEAFKTFIMVNCAVFGIKYDPVDRRADEFKYPNKYDAENIMEYSKMMLEKSVGATLEKIQNNVIANMVKAGTITAGTEVQFGIGEGVFTPSESYSNGSLKYAEVVYPVAFAIGDKQASTTGKVQLVSGQLKKPRELTDTVLTMTAVKAFFVAKGLLPEPVVKEKEKADIEATDAVAEGSKAE